MLSNAADVKTLVRWLVSKSKSRVLVIGELIVSRFFAIEYLYTGLKHNLVLGELLLDKWM